ncbi:hypothetical protein EP04_02005 [Listeria monocytogenes]|uniref:DUF3006 domain-containing protein n=1 Tax=Listeria innocua TaxID=1642 RepID=A0AB73HA00_LISIO|nr:hypothetical protein [Listeria innocua]EAE1298310.1 hypothetical protein [Listeria monocytogenes]MBC2142838.1 hypothetical protein [Listeria innocua]
MVKAFVKLGKNGYIQEWIAVVEEDGHILIETDEALITNNDCVKVVDGIAVLDEAKQAEIQEENKELLQQIEKEKGMYE